MVIQSLLLAYGSFFESKFKWKCNWQCNVLFHRSIWKCKLGLHFHFPYWRALCHSFNIKMKMQYYGLQFHFHVPFMHVIWRNCIIIIIKPFWCLYSKWLCNLQLAMQCSISSFNLKMQIGLHFHFQRRHALFKSILKSKCNYVVCNFIFRKHLWIEV